MLASMSKAGNKKYFSLKFKEVYKGKRQAKYIFPEFIPHNYRSSHRTCSMKKHVLRNFPKFTGKHLYWSLFLIKLKASCRPWCFAVYFAKFVRTPFVQNTSRRLLLQLVTLTINKPRHIHSQYTTNPS